MESVLGWLPSSLGLGLCSGCSGKSEGKGGEARGDYDSCHIFGGGVWSLWFVSVFVGLISWLAEMISLLFLYFGSGFP